MLGRTRFSRGCLTGNFDTPLRTPASARARPGMRNKVRVGKFGMRVASLVAQWRYQLSRSGVSGDQNMVSW